MELLTDLVITGTQKKLGIFKKILAVLCGM